MSQLKVNTIRHTGASSDAVTLASDGTCTVKATNNLGNRNLIINGAMQVAQRGTSSTAEGYVTVDRWKYGANGNDEVFTTSQHALTSSDTGPWEKGFRRSWHIQNGNQSSGAGAADYIECSYPFEGQEIANSGWNYNSTSSYITLSFWVKSSVAQNFYGYFRSNSSPEKQYRFETGSLSDNTWTKVTVTAPGHADIVINDDNTNEFMIWIAPFYGTNYTDNGNALSTWVNYSSSTIGKDYTSTWWTTDDATFELTGVQLEVGDVATDFEHRRYDNELHSCQRYFFSIEGNDSDYAGIMGYAKSDSDMRYCVRFPVPMRANPSYTGSATSFCLDAGNNSTEINLNTLEIWKSIQTPNPASCAMKKSPGSMTEGQAGQLVFMADNGFMHFSAEL